MKLALTQPIERPHQLIYLGAGLTGRREEFVVGAREGTIISEQRQLGEVWDGHYAPLVRCVRAGVSTL